MKVDFTKGNGLVPAIIQDHETKQVLMLGYMNQEAYQRTSDERKVTFYSRSKDRLWTKGETSGNFLHVVQLLVDCDQDTLLIYVKPEGPVCHTGSDTCFDEKNAIGMEFLAYLQEFLKERKAKMPEGSYTTKLYAAGPAKIAQKVGEEAVELVIEALQQNNRDEFLGEASDLMYHLMVLLIDRGYSLNEVSEVLRSRHK